MVIDTGNYVPRQRDGKIEVIENGTIESRWTEAHLGHPVVKAFNNIRAQQLLTLGKPAGAPGRVALPVAGDDALAKAVVIELVEQLGFDGVDAGGLDDSWRQQPGTPVYCTDLDIEGVRKALAAASPTRRVDQSDSYERRPPRTMSRDGLSVSPVCGCFGKPTGGATRFSSSVVWHESVLHCWPLE